MDKLVDSLDFTALPPHLVTFIIACIFNPNQTYTDEMQLMEEFKDFLKIEKEGKARQSRATARQMEAEADIHETTAQESKKSYEERWQTPKGK